MEISFQSKEESKYKQEKEFLALSKTERFLNFLALSKYFLSFPTKKKEVNENNFTITIIRK